jgi:hypothetical protein
MFFQISPHETMAIQEVDHRSEATSEGIRSQALATSVRRDHVCAAMATSAPAFRSILLALARGDWGIWGFYFALARRAPVWETSSGTGSCGRKADVGVLYLEANPLTRWYGLLCVAGLESMETVGAAQALQDGRVVEAIM